MSTASISSSNLLRIQESIYEYIMNTGCTFDLGSGQIPNLCCTWVCTWLVQLSTLNLHGAVCLQDVLTPSALLSIDNHAQVDPFFVF